VTDPANIGVCVGYWLCVRIIYHNRNHNAQIDNEDVAVQDGLGAAAEGPNESELKRRL
jgi:hypothetical protein